MSLIHVLDEVTASQIAAGEVVERPVNAVKEMVENAVDASASDIEVEIADGGMTYIRVTDNGSGMSTEDAKLSIVRHATSKISTVDNIYHISSLGFRGEALASISSVSRTAITTRRPNDEEGTIVEVEGGQVTAVKPMGAPAGTTIEVRDLFYNVPARKKFLKSERTESSRINSMMGKLALANPDIAFRLINNGRTVLETPGNGRLMDVISALYGVKTVEEMLEVHGDGNDIIMQGMISKPSLLKSSRQYQTVIINRRVVDSAVISKAVDNAYHSMLPKNGYPLLVLSFQVPPESIDVNVHPQKREIKFSDEQSVFRLVYHGVLETLTSQDTVDHIAKEMVREPGHQVLHGGEFNPSKVQVGDASSLGHDIGLSYPKADGESYKESISSWEESPSTYGNTKVVSHYGHDKSMERNRDDLNQHRTSEERYMPSAKSQDMFSTHSVFGQYQPESQPKKEVETDPLFTAPKEEEPIIPLGQVSDCFILCRRGRDLFIIDQHAAHERVRYDRMAARAEGIPVQDILVPYLIHVDVDDVGLLLERQNDLKRLGITFEQAGPDVIRITGTPEDLTQSDMERVIKDILVAFHDKNQPSPETLRHRMMAYAACRGAIKQGDPLNIRQMKELIVDLFHTTRPFVCPHGRPTIVKFTPEELGRLFKRP